MKRIQLWNSEKAQQIYQSLASQSDKLIFTQYLSRKVINRSEINSLHKMWKDESDVAFLEHLRKQYLNVVNNLIHEKGTLGAQ